MRRLPTTFVLVAIAAGLLLAACEPSSPTPIPRTLTLTGATPRVALPGDTVTLSGSAFATGHSVTFDGMPVTVAGVADDGASMAVVVPDTAGYPVIAVEDVELESALFVGHEYAGPLTLAGIQAALDPLPEGAALRVGAGSYTGTELTVDNRSLYGAGAATLLQPTTGLLVLARSQNTSVLADLRVEGGDLVVTRGRLTTAEAEPPASFATVLLTDLDLDLGLLRTPDADYVEVVLRDSAVAASSVDAAADLGRLRVERSTIAAPAGIVLQNTHGIAVVDARLTAAAGPFVLYGGSGVEVTRSELVGQDGLSAYAHSGPMVLEDVAAASEGAIAIQAVGGLAVEGTTLASTSDAIAILAYGGATLRDSALSAGTAFTFQSQHGETHFEGSTLAAATDLHLSAQGAAAIGTSTLSSSTGSITIAGLGGLDVTDSTLTSGATISVQSSFGDLAWRSTVVTAVDAIILYGEGRSTIVDGAFASTADGLYIHASHHLVVNGTTIDVAGEVRVLAEGGTASLLDADVTTAAGSAVVNARGAVVVEGGSVSAAAGAFSLASTDAGDVTLRGSVGIAADALIVHAGTAPYVGNNGTVTIVANGPIGAASFLVVEAPFSDLIVADNAPIVAGSMVVNGGRSHVTLRDNERLESGTDLTVAAPVAGGRITATGNAFVANAGAGTIALDTVAGQLTQSDNVFTGTTSFPNNP
jgi:hypothetical protein